MHSESDSAWEKEMMHQAGEAQRVGDLATAMVCYEQVVTRNPMAGEAWFHLGVFSLGIADYPGAISFLMQAHEAGLQDVACLINLGEAYRRNGQLDEAAYLLEAVCGEYPHSHDASLNFAVVLNQKGEHARSAQTLETLVAQFPQSVGAWVAKGEVEKTLNRLDLAVAAFNRALALDAGREDALLGMAESKRLQKSHAEAGAYFQLLLGKNPRNLGALTGLAAVALEQQENGAAEEIYRQALALNPDYWEAIYGCAIAQFRGKNFAEAEVTLKRALDLNPLRDDVWMQLGEALFYQNKHDEGRKAYEQGLALNPDSDSCLIGISNIALHQQQLDVALAGYHRLLKRLPGDYRLLANLALSYLEAGEFAKAKRYGLAAIAANADEEELEAAYQNLGQICLRKGDLEEGWRYYDSRTYVRKASKALPMAPWQGESLAGKRILLWQDQGIGDVIFFAALYPEIIAQAGSVVIQCDQKLIPLMRRSFPLAIVVPRIPGSYHPLAREGVDYHCPGGSLPRFLRNHWDQFPKPPKSILKVDKDRARYWGQRLQALGPELKIGICWRSRFSHGRRELSYSSLADWAEVFALPGVRFINLQYDQCDGELDAVKRDFGVDVVRFSEVDLFDDLDEATALMSQLDLVISAPTSVSMQASGVGTMTYLATAYPDWSCLGRRRDPWFKQMTRYARRWNQSWKEIFDAMAKDLRRRYKL